MPESPFERGQVGPPDDEAAELAARAGLAPALALWDVCFLEVVVGAAGVAWIDRAVEDVAALPLEPEHLSGPVFAFGDVEELLLDRLAVLSLGAVIRSQEELEAVSSPHLVETPLGDRELTAWRAPHRDGAHLVCLLNAWGRLNLVEMDLESKIVDVEPLGPGYTVGRIRPQAMCADGRPPDPDRAWAAFSDDDDFAPEALERLAEMYPTLAAVANRAGVAQASARKNYERALELVQRAVELAPDNARYQENLRRIADHTRRRSRE